jgi:hypothetical protein
LPVVENDLKPAARGVCFVPIAMPSLTGHVVLAGIFWIDTVFRYALENFACKMSLLIINFFVSIR